MLQSRTKPSGIGIYKVLYVYITSFARTGKFEGCLWGAQASPVVVNILEILALGRQLFTADVVLTKGCPTCVVAIDTGMLGFPVA